MGPRFAIEIAPRTFESPSANSSSKSPSRSTSIRTRRRATPCSASLVFPSAPGSARTPTRPALRSRNARLVDVPFELRREREVDVFVDDLDVAHGAACLAFQRLHHLAHERVGRRCARRHPDLRVAEPLRVEVLGGFDQVGLGPGRARDLDQAVRGRGRVLLVAWALRAVRPRAG